MCDKIALWLKTITPQTTALIGLGNPDRGDDRFGLELADCLKQGWPGPVFSEMQQSVEGIVFEIIARHDIHFVCFMDAMDFDGQPGEIDIFGSESLDRFVPAFSTHKVPITLLMGLLAEKKIQPYLLGIQPVTTALFEEMSRDVASMVKQIICTMLSSGQ